MRRGRRFQLLDLAAGLMAERGYHGVSVSDLAEAAGVSGPAIYRHFPSKQAILAQMLTEISQRLLHQAKVRVAAAETPREAVESLIAGHISFAITESNLIRVQERDLASLPASEQADVRHLQRSYIDVWIAPLRQLIPELDAVGARLRVQATFGLLNSTPHTRRGISEDRMALELGSYARAVLFLGSKVATP